VTALGRAAGDYLALRHCLGHKLADAGRLLPRFVGWLDREGIQTITVEAALVGFHNLVPGSDLQRYGWRTTVMRPARTRGSARPRSCAAVACAEDLIRPGGCGFPKRA
jgi:hypothetical protein